MNTREDEEREFLEDTFLRLVKFARGARFFAICEGNSFAFSTLCDDDDDEEACRFASDDVVEEENDERRFWVDVVIVKVKNPNLIAAFEMEVKKRTFLVDLLL